uniref:C2H2-type domain-containing protein n=1 Tax=Anopheles culicifacies TaxID=139723 RepID=A0A182M3C5_9DIPT
MDDSKTRLISIKIEPITSDVYYNRNNIKPPDKDSCFNEIALEKDIKHEELESDGSANQSEDDLENLSERTSLPNGASERTIAKPCKRRKFCTICRKYLSNIAEHRRMHLNIRIQNCPYCQKSFVHRSNLYAHLNIHTQERIYKCEYCDSEFTCIQGLKQHRTIHFEGQYVCTICNRKYNRKFYLRIHVERVHMPKEKHKCLHCDREFLNP